MRRRAVIWSAAGAVAACVAAGGYLTLSLAADDVPVAEPLRTTAAYVRDVEHALTFDGAVSTVTRTDPGPTTLLLDAAVDPLVLYDLVPSLDAGGVTTTVSITGRRGTFACGSLAVLDPPSATVADTPSGPQSGHGGGVSVRADGATGPGEGAPQESSTTPPAGATAQAEAEAPSPRGADRHLRCTVPDDVTAFAGLEATLQVTYRTTAAVRRTLSLPTFISSETAPGTVVDDHRSVRAAVDPALLYRLAPAIEAEQVTGTASVVGRQEEFTCEAVTLEDDADGMVSPTLEQTASLAPPPTEVLGGTQGGRAVACRVPAGVEVYDGVSVRLQVSTARAADVLVVPLTAVRTTGVGTGVVALVTRTDADGVQTTANRAVTLGLDDGLVVEITDGVVEGDLVVDPVSQR